MVLKQWAALLAGILLSVQAFCQDAEQLYKQALLKIKDKQYSEAITLLDESIKQKPAEYLAWYNRGLAKHFLRMDEAATTDFAAAITMQPTYKNAWLMRGIAEKDLTHYDSAFYHLQTALYLDNANGEACYHIARIYELQGKRDSACLYFNMALQYQYMEARKKTDECRRKDTSKITIHPLLKLTTVSADNSYGFSKENPVKVGMGPDGGPANQQRYIELLRDGQGMPVQYKRLSSCCAYQGGTGWDILMLDQYAITYRDTKGRQHTDTLYMDFNQYSAPQVLKGFKAVE